MANPIDFPEKNFTFVKPDGMCDAECGDLPVLKCTDGRVVSCWELTAAEKISVAETGRVWLSVHMNGHMPPVFIGDYPFIKDTMEGDVISLSLNKNISVLKAARIHHGLTQEKLANLAEISVSSVRRAENNERITLSAIKCIRALGYSPEFLPEGEDE